jgi:hypothetical protein
MMDYEKYERHQKSIKREENYLMLLNFVIKIAENDIYSRRVGITINYEAKELLNEINSCPENKPLESK